MLMRKEMSSLFIEETGVESLLILPKNAVAQVLLEKGVVGKIVEGVC